MTRSEPGPTVKVEPSTRSTCTRPLVVVLMRSLKKIDLPILSWVCGEPLRLENASGLTAAATPTLSAWAAPIAAKPRQSPSNRAVSLLHSPSPLRGEGRGEGDVRPARGANPLTRPRRARPTSPHRGEENRRRVEEAPIVIPQNLFWTPTRAVKSVNAYIS